MSAIHHAHEAHLVPDLLKKMWGGPPGAAIFAAFSRYKSEAYRHSTQAPKILADAGIQVAMKVCRGTPRFYPLLLVELITLLHPQSDHPGINSRYVLHEAVQAHHYGLEGERRCYRCILSMLLTVSLFTSQPRPFLSHDGPCHTHWQSPPCRVPPQGPRCW